MQLAHNLASSPLQGEEAFIYIGDEINSVLDPHKNLPTWASSSVSPSVARAHAMEEFSTLSVPHVLVVDKPMFLGPEDLKQLCPSGKQLDLQLLVLYPGCPARA